MTYIPIYVPIIMYNMSDCFTRITAFPEFQVSSFVAVYLPVSELSLFIENYTIYNVYCNICVFIKKYKYTLYIPFVIIGCCISELHGHLCIHYNVSHRVVLLLFHKNYNVYLLTCWYIRLIGFYDFVMFRCSTPSGF